MISSDHNRKFEFSSKLFLDNFCKTLTVIRNKRINLYISFSFNLDSSFFDPLETEFPKDLSRTFWRIESSGILNRRKFFFPQSFKKAEPFTLFKNIKIEELKLHPIILFRFIASFSFRIIYFNFLLSQVILLVNFVKNLFRRRYPVHEIDGHQNNCPIAMAINKFSIGITLFSQLFRHLTVLNNINFPIFQDVDSYLLFRIGFLCIS